MAQSGTALALSWNSKNSPYAKAGSRKGFSVQKSLLEKALGKPCNVEFRVSCERVRNELTRIRLLNSTERQKAYEIPSRGVYIF